MKRLCLFISVSLALCAAATDLVDRENFESSLTPVGVFYGGPYWRVPEEGEGVSIVVDDDQGRCLKVQHDETTVYRTLPYNHNITHDDSYVKLIDDVVFDAKLQFTANDDLSVPELESDSKFSLWLYGDSERTNLYVTAGGNSTTGAYNAPTNYCLDVAVEADTWHRVTVRGLKNVSTVEAGGESSGNMMGFVVFIDGVQATCVDADYAAKLPPIVSPTIEAEYYIERAQLFPSIMGANPYSKRSSSIVAAGFLGTGMVDDITIAYAGTDEFSFTEKPDLFKFTWDEGVTGFTFRTNGVDVAVAEPGPSALLLDVTGRNLATVISVTNITRVAGWIGDESYSATLGDGGLDITSLYELASVYEIDGGARYETLAAAMADVAEGGTITLLGDIEESIGSNFLQPTKSFTLDLAGHSLKISGASNRPVFYLSSGTVTIVSSVAGGELDVTGSRSLFQFSSANFKSVARIGAAEGDEGVLVDGKLLYDSPADYSHFPQMPLAIVQGRFSDGDAADCLARGSQCSVTPDVSGYWVVVPGSEEPAVEPAIGDTEYSSAEEAAAVVEAHIVAWPDDSDLPETSRTNETYKAKYSALFTLSQDGKVVRVELAATGEAIDDVKAALTEATDSIKLDEVTKGQDSTVTVTTVPGLYYGVSSGSALDDMEVETWTIATEETLDLTVPARQPEDTSGFYRIEASPTK